MLDRRGDGVEDTVRFARKDFRRRRFAGHRRRLRAWLVTLLVLAVLGVGVWVVLFSGQVTAREVEVAGNASVSDARVERVGRVPMGTPLARVDVDAVAARVESIPAVRRAEVTRSWPHGIRIAVTERTPVAVIDRGDGLQAMDEDGVLFGGYRTRPRGLPLVRSTSVARSDALVEAGRVIGALPASIARKVDVIEVASIDQIRLVLGNGRRVLWGSAESSEQKAEVLAVLLPRESREIDVSVPGRPTTR